MNLAIASGALPELGLEALWDRAQQWGYDGLEITGQYGHVDLGPAQRLLDEAAAWRGDDRPTIAALNTRMSFCHADRESVRMSVRRVHEAVRIAGEIGCERVIVGEAHLRTHARRAQALAQTIDALTSLAAVAERSRVRILLENGEDLPRSDDLWHIRDAVDSPWIGVSLNPIQTLLVGEALSISVPRVGRGLGLVRVLDAAIDTADGEHLRYCPVGAGVLDPAKLVELLKGLAYRGWLVADWPSGIATGMADEVLPGAAERLRAELGKEVVELTAYKGDKNAPRFASN